MAHEVRIKLTPEQKAKIKSATGQDVNEIRFGNVGSELAVTGPKPQAATRAAVSRAIAGRVVTAKAAARSNLARTVVARQAARAGAARTVTARNASRAMPTRSNAD
jgi:hypothetical protein